MSRRLLILLGPLFVGLSLCGCMLPERAERETLFDRDRILAPVFARNHYRARRRKVHIALIIHLNGEYIPAIATRNAKFTYLQRYPGSRAGYQGFCQVFLLS